MPSMEEQLALIKWVEALPAREGVKGYQNVLKTCAERYGSTPAGLHTVIEHQAELYRRSVRNMMRQARKSLDDSEMPDPKVIKEAMDKALHAALLRMWTYSSEYYQRWTAHDLIPDASEFDSFLKDLEEPEEGVS